MSNRNIDPDKRVVRIVEHENGPRWFEQISVSQSEITGYDVYLLKTMRGVRTRSHHFDGSQSISDGDDKELEGGRRLVALTAKSSRHPLRNGAIFINDVIISREDGSLSFVGQMTIHGKTISLRGYHGLSMA